MCVLQMCICFSEFDLHRSIVSGCTAVNLSNVEQSWMTTPPQTFQISFQFEHLNNEDIVINMNGRGVGSLFGDGAEISFERATAVMTIDVCLLVNNTNEEVREGRVWDFGYSDETYTFVHPLHVSNVSVEVIAASVFLCADLVVSEVPSTDGKLRLFPIQRDSDDSGDKDYVSNETRILCYILGAFYALDLLLLCIFLIVLMMKYFRNSKVSHLMILTSVLFVILCIFRICFMFMYPNGVLSSLAQYIVFEIPTFILFTLVIGILGMWEKMQSKKGFFMDSRRGINVAICIAVAFVWAIFIIISIVYPIVILEQSPEMSPCPGRVASSTDNIEHSTRSLSVAYQSVVIFFSFVLAVLFLLSTLRFTRMVTTMSEARLFIIRLGALIVFTFLLRCIFFIIILAVDFASSIYMFIILFITEVLLIFLAQLSFNWKMMTGRLTKILTRTPGSIGPSSHSNEHSHSHSHHST